jgi:hypothetical protein
VSDGSWTKAVVGMSAAIARTAVEGVAVGRERDCERMLRGLESVVVSGLFLS